MKNKKICGFLLTMLVMTTVLSACSRAGTSSNSLSLHHNEVVEKPQTGGVVTYGYSSPFMGFFEPAFMKVKMTFMCWSLLLRPCLR